MADPLALLGYQPQQPLPALSARPPALNYLGPDAAQAGWLNYATQPLPQGGPVVTSTGLPDIEALQHNMAGAFTEQLKARQAQARAAQEVIGAISTLNPRSNDYLTQRNNLLQKAPWALQSKDVNNILQIQEEAHKEHAGEIKNLGEFSDKYHAEYQNLKKSGKNDPDASALAMAAALTAKARVDFMEQGAPRDVVDRVFKKDGAFDREAMAEWKGEQKRMEFDKKMSGDKGGFIPISQDQATAISETVDDTLREPTLRERLTAYNKKHGTKYEIDSDGKAKGDYPAKAYEDGWNLYKSEKESELRRMVNKLALSGYKIPKALTRYVDSEETTDELDRVLSSKLNVPQNLASDTGSGASTQPQAVAAISAAPGERSTASAAPVPVVNSVEELKALKLPPGTQFKTADGRIGRMK